MGTRNEKQSPHLRLSQRPSGHTEPRAAPRTAGGAERLVSGQVRAPECPQVTRGMS